MGISVGTVIKGVQVWRSLKPYKRWKRRREMKRAKQRAEAAAAGGEFLYQEEDDMKLKGKLTYTGIAAAALGMVLGWVGLGDCTPEMIAELGEAACQEAQAVAFSLVDRALALGGLAVAVYGRYRATRKAAE